MAQLRDDCFAFDGPLLPVAEAERLIAERVAPVEGRETVTLREALGRVLAEDVVAPVNVPPFDNSAVDGYAVRGDDLTADGDKRLTIVDRVAAGHAATHGVNPGEAIRIFTGAPMPAGADTVFMQEDCRVDGGSVVVPPGLKRGANRRLAGEDLRAGAIAMPAGRRLAVQHVALAAALGLTKLTVHRRVRIALFSTGDEIVEPGAALPRASLYDSNRYLLSGLLARFNVEVTDLGILSDEPSELKRALAAAAAEHDLVLTSGGVSAGEADHVRNVIASIGRLVFWRVAIKPGRPVAMAVIPSGTSGHSAAFVGLPGNPVAVFVTFVRVVRPLLLRLSGALPEPLLAMPARATFSYKKRKGRREYVRVALRAAADGVDRSGQIRAGRRRRADFAYGDRRAGRARRGRDQYRARRDGGLSFLRVAGRLDVGILRGDIRGAGGVFGRVDVEERIDRRGRPIGEGDAVTRRPDFDLAQAVVDQRAAQILAQRDRPERDDGMAPFARARAGQRRRRPRCALHAAAPPDLSAGTDNRPARSTAIGSLAHARPPNRARRGCRQAGRQNPARCRRRPAARCRRSAPDRRWR